LPRLLTDTYDWNRPGFLDFEGFGGKVEGMTKAKPNDDSKIAAQQQPWQEKIKELPAFRLSSAVLTDGTILRVCSAQ
jgi:hypothetical protein